MATASKLGGIIVDQVTLSIDTNGLLSVNTIDVASLADVSTVGGPALSDLDTVNRAGADYKATLAEKVALFRRTPAGSRTVAFASGATTATLTAADHDKAIVVTGSIAGTLAVDGTITDGFRCQVINHTGSALTYSGITGLQGSASLPNNASCWVSFSNATVEATLPGSVGGAATPPGGSSGQLQYNNAGAFAGATLSAEFVFTGAALSIGSIAPAKIAQGGASAGQVLGWTGTAWGPTTAASGYTLQPATTSALGGVKAGGGTLVAGDGTLAIPASFAACVIGVVNTLPGGAGAVVYRHCFMRPCGLAANLAAPFAPQAKAGTPPSASASFTVSKLSAGGATSTVGTISISPTGVVTATATAASFGAGDELIVSAPSPADSTLADVALTFSGLWS